MSNISDFIARLKKTGLLRSNRYRVYFSGNGFTRAYTATSGSFVSAPTGTIAGNVRVPDLSGIPGLNETLSDACEIVSFPGSTVASMPYKVHGPARDIPYERLYDGDLEVSFRLDASGMIRRFFMNWQALIVDPQTNDLGYYDDYVCDMTIDIINNDDDVVMSGKLYEVWPKEVKPLSLGYANNEDYLRQEISFAYRKFVQE